MIPAHGGPAGSGIVVLPWAPSIAGLVARAPDAGRDIPAVVELIATTNAHDGSDWIPTVETLDHQWRLTPGFEPARDVLLVEIDERLAAFARVTWRERAGKVINQIEVTVRPEHRRRRLGSALLAWAERRARSAIEEGVGGPTDLPHFLGGWGETDIPGVRDFATHHGYVPIRYFFSMLRDLTQPIPDLPMPAGLKVRPVREADHRAIWDAEVEAFRDHFEAGVQTEADFVRRYTNPDTDTSMWQVAWDGSEVAGSVNNAVHPSENEAFGYRRGWLESVSVRRPWRGRGLASALIARSLAVLRDRGLTEAALGVDGENPTGALQIYERMGFVVHRRAEAFRKSF